MLFCWCVRCVVVRSFGVQRTRWHSHATGMWPRVVLCVRPHKVASTSRLLRIYGFCVALQTCCAQMISGVQRRRKDVCENDDKTDARRSDCASRGGGGRPGCILQTMNIRILCARASMQFAPSREWRECTARISIQYVFSRMTRARQRSE